LSIVFRLYTGGNCERSTAAGPGEAPAVGAALPHRPHAAAPFGPSRGTGRSVPPPLPPPRVADLHSFDPDPDTRDPVPGS
jgi:hypothetical protein